MHSFEPITSPYDQGSLLKATLYAERDWYDERFNTYYENLAKTLWQTFDVDFSKRPKDLQLWVVWSELKRTIRSYHSIRTPRSGVLEATASNVRLRKFGSEGEAIFEHLAGISNLARQM